MDCRKEGRGLDEESPNACRRDCNRRAIQVDGTEQSGEEGMCGRCVLETIKGSRKK